MMLIFLLFILIYGQNNNFDNILQQLPKNYINIPYQSFPEWCTEKVNQVPGQELTYKKVNENQTDILKGFLTESGDVRIAMANKTNTDQNQVFMMLFFKKNSKNSWYQDRTPVLIWLAKKKGALTCMNN
jgi:hypothetical protein